MGSPEINGPHLLLGMLAEPNGLAARLLAAVDADLDMLAADLQTRLGPIDPAPMRPRLGRDAARAIRATAGRARTSAGSITTAHLLMSLTAPFSGWSRAALKRAGVTRRAVRSAYKSLPAEGSAGLDAAEIAWVWDYLPQSGRLINAGESAQAAGDLPLAIRSYQDALASAKTESHLVTPGALGEIYSRLIKAHLLAGDSEAAIRWHDEADEYLEDCRFQPFPGAAGTPASREFAPHIEEGVDLHMEALRLELLRNRAQIHLVRDEFAALERAARDLIDTAQQCDHVNGIAAGRHLLGLALAFQGSADDDAERNLRAGLEPAEVIDPVDIASCTYSLATFALLREDYKEAQRLATVAAGMYDELGLRWSVTGCRLAHAEGLVGSGGALPPDLLEEAEKMDPDGRATLLGRAWRLDARSKRTNDTRGASVIIERAVEMSRNHNHRLLLVRCLLDQGRILRLLEDLAGARAAFGQALRLGEAMGVRFASEAQRELDALGTDRP